jgi:hypothetical protein
MLGSNFSIGFQFPWLTMVVKLSCYFYYLSTNKWVPGNLNKNRNQRTTSSSYSKTLKEQLTGIVGMKERTWAKESMVGYLGAQPNVFKTFENHGYISEPGI